jgi:hypothetical protein
MANGNSVNAGLAAFQPQGVDAQTLQGVPPAQTSPAPGPDSVAGTAAMATAATPPSSQQQAASVSAPTPNIAPGSFAWKLARVLGGTMQALQSVGGPTVAAPPDKVPAGAGALYGATSAAADIQKKNRERDIQQREQARLDENQQIEKQKAAAYIAHENVATYHDQMLVWEQGDQAVDKSGESGKMLMEAYTNPPSGVKGSEIFQENVDGGELQAALQKANADQYKKTGKYLDPTQMHIYPTGSKPVTIGTDSAGNPIVRKRQLYTVVEDMPDVTLNQAQTEYLAKFTDQKLAWDPKSPVKMPGYLYGTLSQQAKSTETAQLAVDDMRSELGLEALSIQEKKNLVNQWPQLGKALAQGKMDPFKTGAALEQNQPGGMMAFLSLFKNTDPKKGELDPTGIIGATKIEAIYQKEAFEQWSKMIGLEAKLPWGDASKANDPKAFRMTLNPEQQKVVDSVYDGTAGIGNMSLFLSRSMQTGQDIFGAVKATHPDFDATKVENFVTTVAKQFMSGKSGDAGFALTGMDTAMKHMRDLYDTDTLTAALPLTARSARRGALVNNVSGEIERSIYASSVAEREKGIVDTLNPANPATWNDALMQYAKNVMERYSSYQNQWLDNIPSQAYAKQMPSSLSNRGLSDYAYLINKGKLPKAPVVMDAGVVGPAGAAVGAMAWKTLPGKDGRNHWFAKDIRGNIQDLGVAE